MPLKFLFQPWKAPQKVQEKTRCIIGKDYPKPMVDHRTAAADCKRKMEEVKAILKDPSTYILVFLLKALQIESFVFCCFVFFLVNLVIFMIIRDFYIYSSLFFWKFM